MESPNPTTTTSASATLNNSTTTVTTASTTSSSSSSSASSPSTSSATNPTSNNGTTTNDSSNVMKSNGKNKNSLPITIPQTGPELKRCIIEFMRERPFLWDNRHLCYKDHRRREHEFQLFSQKIGISIQEIKRVWHVLRTNFFRAHKSLEKLQLGNDGSHSGNEKLWKYYSAMEYILEGSSATSTSFVQLKREEIESDEAQNFKRTTRSHRSISSTPKNNISTRGSTRSTTVPVTTHQKDSSIIANHNARNRSNYTNLSSSSSSCSNSNNVSLHNNGNCPASLLNDSMEIDDDHLYARSLTSTLKKFDPTTKEIIKLKFQEIIVNYMKQQHNNTHHHHNHQSNHNQTDQANVTTSLAKQNNASD